VLSFLFWREVIVLFGVLFSTYTDIKKGLIYDRVTYPMLLLGALLLLFEFSYAGFNYLYAVVPLLVFVIGYIVYFMGKIGGGDVKLFTAIALLLPVFEGEIFLLNVLFVAAITSIVFVSIYYFSKYARKGISFSENSRDIAKAVFIGLLLIVYFGVMVKMGFSAKILLFLLLPIFCGLLFFAFQTGIKRSFFLKKVPLSKLEEDEIIAREFLSGKAVSVLNTGFKGVLSGKEIMRLKKAGVSEVPVYRDMPPFAPFILIGVVFSLFYPHFFSELFFFL